MDRGELVKKMSQFVREAMMGRVSEVTPEDDLANDIGMDSMGAVEFVTMVEEEYGISVSAGELGNIKTLNDAVDLVLKKMVSQ
jgi:acyl carrier protein